MHRFGLPLTVGLLVVFLIIAPLCADPPADDQSKKLNTLAVQQAMATARQSLRDGQPKKAVDTLENQLSRANGHHGFLELLRDAYRDCVVKLSLDHESTLAQRYLQRLAILDAAAARELTIAPDNGTPIKFEVRPIPAKPSQPLPNFAANQPAPVAKSQPPVVTATSTGAKSATFRGKVEQPGDDPFDASNQRPPSSGDTNQLATQLVARAQEEFTRRRYKEARLYYEQAFHADQRSTDAARDSWAYCMLSDVVETLNRPGLGGKSLTELQKDVHGALALTQTAALSTEGQKLLREIDQRAKTGGARADRSVSDERVPMQHFGKNPQGWQVSETPNFRIFHNQARDLVERVGAVAERTRLEASRKWFSTDGGDWQGKCELVIHPSAAEYSRQTGVPTTSPGHSRIESDPGTHRIIGRRMDLHVDNPSMLEAVLPHETTHCILAGQFGPFQVPRWADEGMAVLSEPAEKAEQHRRNLVLAARDGQLFGVKELLELDNYPQPRRISAFYAQSVALVEFLALQRGPAAVSDFVRDGLRTGWDAAARKNYGWDLAEMQQRWDAQVQVDAQRLAAAAR